MNIKVICLLALSITTSNCFSQDESETDITDITKVTFLNPGFAYEKRIGTFQSLYSQAFMSIAGNISYSSSLGNTSRFYFDPALTIQYRYYYNAARRTGKGKRTAMNSLNFITPLFQTVYTKMAVSSSQFIEDGRRTINTLGLAWGIQRNYKKRFSLDLYLGPGYLFTKATLLNFDTGQFYTENVSEFTGIAQINLGFWLNKE
jgi:hypothetical protein